MSDEDEKKERKQEKAKEGGKKSFIGRFLPWIIMGIVVTVSAGGGFGLGRMLAGPGEPPPSETDPKAGEASQAEDLSPDEGSSGDSEKVWYYDLGPVIANLN
jgi:flagellar basal body-associated protein FliL